MRLTRPRVLRKLVTCGKQVAKDVRLSSSVQKVVGGSLVDWTSLEQLANHKDGAGLSAAIQSYREHIKVRTNGLAGIIAQLSCQQNPPKHSIVFGILECLDKFDPNSRVLEVGLMHLIEKYLDDAQIDGATQSFRQLVQLGYQLDTSTLIRLTSFLIKSYRIRDLLYVLEHSSASLDTILRITEPLLMTGNVTEYNKHLKRFCEKNPKTQDMSAIIRAIMMSRLRRILCHTNLTPVEIISLRELMTILEEYHINYGKDATDPIDYKSLPSYFIFKQLHEIEKESLNLKSLDELDPRDILSIMPKFELFGFPYIIEDRDFPVHSKSGIGTLRIRDITSDINQQRGHNPPLLLYSMILFQSSYNHEMREITKRPSEVNLLSDMIEMFSGGYGGIPVYFKSDNSKNDSGNNNNLNDSFDNSFSDDNSYDSSDESIEIEPVLADGSEDGDDDDDDEDEDDDEDDDYDDDDDLDFDSEGSDDEDDDDDDDDDIDDEDEKKLVEMLEGADTDNDKLDELLNSLGGDIKSKKDDYYEKSKSEGGIYSVMYNLGADIQSEHVHKQSLESFSFDDFTSAIAKSYGKDYYIVRSTFFRGPRYRNRKEAKVTVADNNDVINNSTANVELIELNEGTNNETDNSIDNNSNGTINSTNNNTNSSNIGEIEPEKSE